MKKAQPNPRTRPGSMIACQYKDGIGKPASSERVDSVVCLLGDSRVEVRYDRDRDRMIVSIQSPKPVLMEPRAAGIWLEAEAVAVEESR